MFLQFGTALAPRNHLGGDPGPTTIPGFPFIILPYIEIVQGRRLEKLGVGILSTELVLGGKSRLRAGLSFRKQGTHI